MNITVSLKKRAGVDCIVPEDETAKLFAQVAGTNNLTRQAIEAIKALGFEVNVKQEIRSV